MHLQWDMQLFFSLARLIKEFDREIKDSDYKNDPETNKLLNERKQSMVSICFSWILIAP